MSKEIVLKSSDGERFELALEVAVQCGTIKEMNDDGCANDVIPVPFPGHIFSKVIEFCNKHAEHRDASSCYSSRSLHDWDLEFVNKVDPETLRLLIRAANYLDNEDLLNITVQVVANWWIARTTKEERKKWAERHGW